MQKAQEWFNEKYKKSKEEENKLHLLAIDNRDLDGKLKIEGFSNLETIECFGNKLTSLEIRNCPKLTKICCHQNKLVKLEIKDCPMITYLNVSCNLFKNLEFIDGLDPEKLTFLSVHTNDLRQVNNNDKSGNLSLEVFRNFINLEELYIDNYDKEKFDKGTYNHFSGSLEPLKDLKDLRLLNISGTDINSGLEYLSESIKKIGCNDNGLGRECSKIRKVLEDAAKSNGITEELEGFEEGDTKWTEEWYRIAPWREKQDKKIKSAQEWLDKEYPKWERKDKKDLWIHAQNLRGNLDLTEFINLERFYCYNNRLTELKLTNLKNLAEVYAWNNKLVKLDVNGCLKIKKLNVNNNCLPNLDFPNLSNLEFLDITDNDFYSKLENEKLFLNLNCFSTLKKLKELRIGNCHNLGGKKFNRFEGSLEPLKELEELEYLNIDNIDINTGLEHLSENLEEINCSVEKEGVKCKEIKQELTKYSIPGKRNNYDFQAWMRNSEKSKKSLERFFSHQIKLVKELKKIEEIDKKIKEEKQLGSRSKWFGYVGSGLSTIGSGISGVLAKTNLVSAGSVLDILIPSVSGVGGISSAYGTYLANRYAEKEKVYKEELDNNLAKLGIDIWNKFLRDKEELDEKRKLVEEFLNSLFETDKVIGEKAKKSFNKFLMASEVLPKSVSPEEKQRMKKELQEQFIQNLWEGHWEKNNYELKNRLESFLDKLSVKLAKPKEAFKAKLRNILEELENIKKDHRGGTEEQQLAWKIHEDGIDKAVGSVKEILKVLQEENNDKKIGEIMEKVQIIDDEVKSAISGIEIKDEIMVDLDSYFDKDNFEEENVQETNIQIPPK